MGCTRLDLAVVVMMAAVAAFASTLATIFGSTTGAVVAVSPGLLCDSMQTGKIS